MMKVSRTLTLNLVGIFRGTDTAGRVGCHKKAAADTTRELHTALQHKVATALAFMTH